MTSKQLINQLCYEYSTKNYNEEKLKTIQEIKKDLNLLKEYRKIEEEIGIDLVMLFSALESGVYYFDNQGQLIHDWVSLISNNIDVGPHDKLSYSFMTFYDRQILPFEDHGKTFALTREELENGKKI